MPKGGLEYLITHLFIDSIKYNSPQLLQALNQYKETYIKKEIQLSQIIATCTRNNIKNLKYFLENNFKIKNNIEHTGNVINKLIQRGHINVLHWIFVRNFEWISSINILDALEEAHDSGHDQIVTWIKKHQDRNYKKLFLYVLRRVFPKIDDNVPNEILSYVHLGFHFKKDDMALIHKQLLFK
jgi:hypothetical protein